MRRRRNATIQKQNVANAGEYYIAALLSAQNYTATITLGHAERYDILAVSPAGKVFKFSVKTRFQREASAFTLSDKDERDSAEDLFYVFVRLHEFKHEPEYWVVPSKRVSEVITSAFHKFIRTKDKYGKKHNDTPIRKLPIELRGSDLKYFSQGWEKEMENYHNNLKVLKTNK